MNGIWSTKTHPLISIVICCRDGIEQGCSSPVMLPRLAGAATLTVLSHDSQQDDPPFLAQQPQLQSQVNESRTCSPFKLRGRKLDKRARSWSIRSRRHYPGRPGAHLDRELVQGKVELPLSHIRFGE